MKKIKIVFFESSFSWSLHNRERGFKSVTLNGSLGEKHFGWKQKAKRNRHPLTAWSFKLCTIKENPPCHKNHSFALKKKFKSYVSFFGVPPLSQNINKISFAIFPLQRRWTVYGSVQRWREGSLFTYTQGVALLRTPIIILVL